MATAVPNGPVPLSNSKFVNWIKAALAVFYTKEEIEPVVIDEVKDFQQNCLHTISSSNSLLAGSTCSYCCTENLIVCPTNRICNVNRGKCYYHKNVATQYRPSGCPNKICHNLKSEIQKAHRYHGPSYRNTDATKWCSNAWEIAKCYLPPDGYKDVSNAAETDFNGIISVIINHKGFEAKIKDDLSKKNNIFDKGRDVGKAVRHSPNLEVEDTDLTQYFTILINILTDPGFVAMNKSPNNAIQKLAKLQSDDLIIGKDVVRKVLDDVGKTIQEQIRNEMDEYKQKTEERKLELINIINLKVKDIEEKGNISLAQLNDAVKSSIDAFDAKVKESIQEIDSQTRKGKETLESVTNDGVQNVNKEKENAIKEIQNAAEKSRGNDAAVKSSIDAFEAKVTESIQEIGSQTRKGKETIESVTNDGVQNVNKEKENAIKEIQKAAEKSRGNDANAKISEDTYQKKKEDEKRQESRRKKNLFQRGFEWIQFRNTKKTRGNDANAKISDDTYQKKKKELKDGLSEFYKTRHSKVFLSPLFEENDTPLSSFYIRPELNLKESAQTRNDKDRQVISLSAMFETENQAHREIHVIADAGLGKTAFSNYLAITWCQAHFPEEDMTQTFKKDDIDCMQGFDFLFLVLLRDSNDLCSIDDLIFKKIVSDLGLEEKPSEDFLLKILKNEKCLVILDGLDEWTHPEKECHRSPRSFPHRNDRKKCTVLTTTRPWKLGVLNLNSCQIGQKVELTKLSYDSAVKLTARILQRLKSHPNKDALQCDVTAFRLEIESSENDELTSVPLLLIYIICLWCDGLQIGSSKCKLYINIIELLLSRTIQKHGDLQQLCDLSDMEIPECFAEYENCTKYYPLLMCIGKLAYYTLFNDTRENTLVFDGSVAKKYLSTDEMKFTLHSGMLSESTSKTLTKKFSKVSFSHKSVQEFFAAIFISSENEGQKIVIEKCRNVQDILDMSIIYEFIIEMNADRMCEISNDLMSVINEDEKTRDYRTRTGPDDMNDNILYIIQVLFICLEEMPESENIQLCLQDFFIDQDTEDCEQLQRLSKQNKTNIKSLYINISQRYSFPCLREIIGSFSLTDLSHIQKLYYGGNSMEKEAEINRILFPSLQYVTLRGGKWTNDEENLSENLARVQNLQYLYIEWFTLSHKILERFFNFVSGQKSMKELTLMVLYCKEHKYRLYNCQRLNLDLSQHSTLSKLHLEWLPGRLQLNITTPSLVNVELWEINLDESSMLLSRDMLNIECVELREIEMSAESLQNFITVLENLPQSVTVRMDAIQPYKEYDRVRKNIRRSQTFHVITDDRPVFVFKTIKPSKE